MSKRVGGFINQDGLNAPDEPTSVSASAGDEEATVSFTAPSDVGGSAITGYVATSNDGIGATGSSSPITVTGLTNDTAYTFRVWALNAFGYSAPSGASGSVTPSFQRAVFGGGEDSTGTNVMSYADIVTTGNAIDFGDLTQGRAFLGAAASSTRGLFMGGVFDGVNNRNTIDYVTLNTPGNAVDFGDLTNTTSPSNNRAACSSETRAVIGPGNMLYVTIASTGNSVTFSTTFDFFYVAAAASSTRGLFCAGQNGGTKSNTINFVTIASTGTITDFGDTTSARVSLCGASNSTRAIFSGGETASSRVNIMDYVTIASAGDATDFGDLIAALDDVPSSAAGSTRLLVGGGRTSGGGSNVIQYVTIASTGNAVDFGDLTLATYQLSACSSAHGGLS